MERFQATLADAQAVPLLDLFCTVKTLVEHVRHFVDSHPGGSANPQVLAAAFTDPGIMRLRLDFRKQMEAQPQYDDLPTDVAAVVLELQGCYREYRQNTFNIADSSLWLYNSNLVDLASRGILAVQRARASNDVFPWASSAPVPDRSQGTVTETGQRAHTTTPIAHASIATSTTDSETKQGDALRIVKDAYALPAGVASNIGAVIEGMASSGDASGGHGTPHTSPPELDGNLTTNQLATLIGVRKKTLMNELSKSRNGAEEGRPPEATVKVGGSIPDSYSYAKILPWLLENFSTAATCLPKSFEEVKQILERRKVT